MITLFSTSFFTHTSTENRIFSIFHTRLCLFPIYQNYSKLSDAVTKYVRIYGLSANLYQDFIGNGNFSTKTPTTLILKSPRCN